MWAWSWPLHPLPLAFPPLLLPSGHCHDWWPVLPQFGIPSLLSLFLSFPPQAPGSPGAPEGADAPGSPGAELASAVVVYCVHSDFFTVWQPLFIFSSLHIFLLSNLTSLSIFLPSIPILTSLNTYFPQHLPSFHPNTSFPKCLLPSASSFLPCQYLLP